MSVISSHRKRRILYFSCHQILEYDDLRMFLDAGHEIFSIGDFIVPGHAKEYFREPRQDFFDKDLYDVFVNTGCDCNARIVTVEFLRHFDIVIINQFSAWYDKNKIAFEGKPIIIRTIGQTLRTEESAYKGLGANISIVRYSEKEVGLPGFARTDAVIYFSKYASDFLEWTGGGDCVTFHNNYLERDYFCCPSPPVFKYFQGRAVSMLYGAGNQGITRSHGAVDGGVMFDILRRATSYFYIYSLPPSYTLSFMEAMFAGCPIIAPSAEDVEKVLHDYTDDFHWTRQRYEIPDFLAEGCGVVYDTIKEAVYAEHWLKASPAAGKAISSRIKKRAFDLFDTSNIVPKWEALFDRVC